MSQNTSSKEYHVLIKIEKSFSNLFFMTSFILRTIFIFFMNVIVPCNYFSGENLEMKTLLLQMKYEIKFNGKPYFSWCTMKFKMKI